MSVAIELKRGAQSREIGNHPVPESDFAFQTGDGELARMIHEKDWSQTPLGAVEKWSPSLRMMVSFMLANRFPLLLWWGPEYVSIYNDPYRPVLGEKHPKSLGQPASECWSEIWHVIGPLIDSPFLGGPPTWMDDLPLEINRHGFIEETHFTVAYSPVPDDTVPDGIGGVLATVHEITEKIVGERRIAVLRDLGARTGETKAVEEACSTAVAALVPHAKDVPFALVYLLDGSGNRVRLASAANIEQGGAIAPIEVALDEASDKTWPFLEALRTEGIVTIENLSGKFPQVPAGPWSDRPHTALVVPIKSNVAHQLAGFLVAGTSPRLRLDEQYRSFFELAASQIATAIATARAYEEERKRAEALAEIDHAKTLFFSNVSHEFRTPLTLMLGPLEDAIADGNLPAKERERLDVAHRNSLRLLKLVNSLLDFSRIEAGRAQASYEPTDLAAVTGDLASNFRSACERAGLRLVVDCPRLPEPVHVDRDMWEKIILNLLSNAFKFTFEGEIAVRLRAAGGKAELEVRDTGVGIPDNELPRLFERFHRIEGQKSRTYEGSGIGLALVQELVRLMGGTIHADSKPGQGTTFTIAIPFGTAHLPRNRIGVNPTLESTSVRAETYVEEALRWLPDAAPFAGPPLEFEPGNELPPIGEGAYILIADDNADMRAYIRRLLGARCEVEAVVDGDAALDAIRARRPDLVLADVMMPRLDGFGLLSAIRADPGLRDIPVIMLSARAGEESRIEGIQAGADDYLVKPFSARDLLARVDGNLKLNKLRQQAEHALRESEARLKLAVEIGGLGHWTLDLQTFELTTSALCRRNFGRAADGPFSYEDLQASIHPEDRERQMLAVGTAIETRSPFEVEYRAFTPAGDMRHIEVRGRFETESGRDRLVGVSLDITERKRAETDLRASEERYRQLVEQTPDGIFVADREGRYVDVNPAGCEMLRMTRGEVLASTFADVLAPEEHHRLAAEVACFDAGSIVHSEWRMRRKDESVFHAEIVGRRLPNGNLQGLVRDVTERKRAAALQGEQQQVLERIATGKPLTECLTLLTGAAARLNPRARACVLLADEARAAFEMAVSANIPPSFGDGIHGAPINELMIGTCGTAVFEARPVSCTDVEQDECWSKEWRELCLAHGIRAGLSTPIFGPEGKALGSFFLCFAEAREPDDWDRCIAESGAHIAAIAIARDRAVRAVAESEQKLSAELAATQQLQLISTELLGESDLQNLYRRVADAAVRIMRADCASMQMLHPDRGRNGELHLIASRGFTPEAERFWEWVPVESNSTCGVAMRTGTRSIVADIETCDFMAGTADRITYLDAGIHAVQSTPLFSRSGLLLGMLSTHWLAPHEPLDSDFRLFDVLARQAADLLERAQSEETLRRRADQLRLLLHELNHRVKNTLATVQSIAMQTLRTATTPADARQALESRLISLSKAHDVLTREHWEGADIHEVVSRAIAPYSRQGGLARFEADGPEIRLLPKAALALSMALHELATNAVKYGSLSTETGKVGIQWHATADEAYLFRLEWAERVARRSGNQRGADLDRGSSKRDSHRILPVTSI